MHISQPIDPTLHVGLFARLRPWVGALILVIGTIVVYAPSLSGDFILGDQLLAGSGWFGDEAAPYRLIHVLLHVTNGLLLLLLLRHLRVPGAWLAAAIFLLHPINVESAAWMSQRANVVSLTFMLASLLAFSGVFVRSDPDPLPLVLRILGYACGVLFLMLAMANRSTAAAVPLVLLMILWWKEGRIDRAILLQWLPLLAIGLIGGLWAAGRETTFLMVDGATLLERITYVGQGLWFYVGKLLLPIRNGFMYPPWAVEPGTLLAALPVVATLALVTLLGLFRERIGRGPLAAVLCYSVMLIPAMRLLDAYRGPTGWMADAVPYHAGAALMVLFSACIAAAADHIASTMYVREQDFTRWVFRALALPFLASLGYVSWQRAHVFHNDITLWRDAIMQYPAAAPAYTRLADALIREGRLSEVEDLFRRAFEKSPENMEAAWQLARLYSETGRADKAAVYYAQVLEAEPDRMDVRNELGLILYRLGRGNEARDQWQEVLERHPQDVTAKLNLAHLHAALGQLEDAARQYESVLEADPANEGARYRLGVVRFRQGRYEQAVTLFESALRQNADHVEALNNLGLSRMRLGQPERALAHYDRALEIRPDFAQAWHNRGVALEQLGRYPDARRSYRRALEADPVFEPARRNLQNLDSMQPLLNR